MKFTVKLTSNKENYTLCIKKKKAHSLPFQFTSFMPTVNRIHRYCIKQWIDQKRCSNTRRKTGTLECILYPRRRTTITGVELMSWEKFRLLNELSVCIILPSGGQGRHTSKCNSQSIRSKLMRAQREHAELHTRSLKTIFTPLIY